MANTHLLAPFILSWRINISSSFRIQSRRQVQRSRSPFSPTNFPQPAKLALPSTHCVSLALCSRVSSTAQCLPSVPQTPRSGAWGGSPAPSLSSLPRAGALRLAYGGTGHAQRRSRGQDCFAGAGTRLRAGARLQLELRLLELELPGVSHPPLVLRARQQ